MKYIKLLTSTFLLTLLVAGSSAGALGSGQIISGSGHYASSAVGNACGGLSAISTTGCTKGGNSITGIAHTVVEILAVVVGVISIIMILFSGIRFILAGGDANAITSARQTLIYAIVGLVVAVLAQLIASEVLTTANKIQQSSYLPISTTKKDA